MGHSKEKLKFQSGAVTFNSKNIPGANAIKLFTMVISTVD